MPALKKKLEVDKEKQEQLKQIKAISERMKRPKPLTIRLPNVWEIELDDDMLDRLSHGGSPHADDWRLIGHWLITSIFPHVILIADDETLPVIVPRQTCF